MSPRIHPDVDPPTDPAVRAAEKALLAEGLGVIGAETPRWTARVAVEAARPIWAAQLAIAVEDTPQIEPGAARHWLDVAEFIRAREERQ